MIRYPIRITAEFRVSVLKVQETSCKSIQLFYIYRISTKTGSLSYVSKSLLLLRNDLYSYKVSCEKQKNPPSEKGREFRGTTLISYQYSSL